MYEKQVDCLRTDRKCVQSGAQCPLKHLGKRVIRMGVFTLVPGE